MAGPEVRKEPPRGVQVTKDVGGLGPRMQKLFMSPYLMPVFPAISWSLVAACWGYSKLLQDAPLESDLRADPHRVSDDMMQDNATVSVEADILENVENRSPTSMDVAFTVAAASIILALAVYLMQPAKKGERSNMMILYYHVGIRVKYLYQGAWLRFWTEAPMSGLSDGLIPHLDYWTMLLFKVAYFVKGQFLTSPLLFVGYIVSGVGAINDLVFAWAESRAVAFYEKRGVQRTKNTPIEEYDWQNGSPEEFYQEYVVKNPRPVVLRKFNTEENLKLWKFETMMEKYGDMDVHLTQDQKDGYVGKLREVEDPTVYLHNCETIFKRNPSLVDALQLGRLNSYIGKGLGYCQLFMGKCGTGTPFHNAAVWNFFNMLDGKKTWYFVSPEHTHLAYPFAPAAGRIASFSTILFPDTCDDADYPMFKFCPVYETTLDAGDVLLNPAWWWHAIKNITPTSVAVASRWHGDGTVGRGFMMTEENYDISRYHSFMFFSGIKGFPFLNGILRTPSPEFDEHQTTRERDNRFTHIQRLMSKGKWKF